MAFSEHEQGRILHFLGYADWKALASSIQLGFPSASEPLFLVYESFKRLGTQGEESVRADLCECESIECQLRDARSRFKALQIGTLKTNPRETTQLRQELIYWRQRLADDLGVVQNPYSQAAYEGDPGGVNARVEG